MTITVSPVHVQQGGELTTMAKVVFHGNSIGRNVPKGWHTTSDAAKLVGRSADTIRRWRDVDPPIFEPSGEMQQGGLTVWLYSDKDIKAMKELAKTLHGGWKKKEE